MKRTTLLSGVAGAAALGSAFGLAQTPNAVAWFAGLAAAAFAAWGVRRQGEDDGWVPLAGGVLAGVAVVVAVAQWLLIGVSGPEALVGGGVAGGIWAVQAASKPR